MVIERKIKTRNLVIRDITNPHLLYIYFQVESPLSEVKLLIKNHLKVQLYARQYFISIFEYIEIDLIENYSWLIIANCLTPLE